MKKYKVAVTKYGFVIVDANNEEQAIEMASNLDDSDFEWSEFQDPMIMEELEQECCSPSYRQMSEKNFQNLKSGDQVYILCHGQISLMTIDDFLPFSDKFTTTYSDEVFGPEDVFEECEPDYDPEYFMDERN